MAKNEDRQGMGVVEGLHMQTPLRRYAEFVVAHPWAVLVVSLLFSTLLGAGVTRLSVDTDPAAHPSRAAQVTFPKSFL